MEGNKSWVGVRELRQNLSVYLDRVKLGESLTVTEHGLVVARLTPPIAGSFLDRLVTDGKAQAPTRRLAEIPRARRSRAKKSLSQWVDDMREDRI